MSDHSLASQGGNTTRPEGHPGGIAVDRAIVVAVVVAVVFAIMAAIRVIRDTAARTVTPQPLKTRMKRNTVTRMVTPQSPNLHNINCNEEGRKEDHDGDRACRDYRCEVGHGCPHNGRGYNYHGRPRHSC